MLERGETWFSPLDTLMSSYNELSLEICWDSNLSVAGLTRRDISFLV